MAIPLKINFSWASKPRFQWVKAIFAHLWSIPKRNRGGEKKKGQESKHLLRAKT